MGRSRRGRRRRPNVERVHFGSAAGGLCARTAAVDPQGCAQSLAHPHASMGHCARRDRVLCRTPGRGRSAQELHLFPILKALVIGWDQFLKHALGGLAGLLAVAFGFIVLMNPYGHLPLHVFGTHVIMDSNQRFQYPAVARSGVFDSVVIGTSSARLLDPEQLEARLGGRFANLAMNAARAWEQYRLARLFLEYQPQPKTVLIALDAVWCDENADVNRITSRGFPEWLYDDNPWNDWLYLLNTYTLEFAGRVAAYRLGLRPPRIPANGFEIFVPPESAYDPIKANKKLRKAGPPQTAPVTPAYAVTE